MSGLARRATSTVGSTITPASTWTGTCIRQTIDGFFGLFKTGVRGAHHAVSHKWLQGYLNEWTWRYNRREDGNEMFRDLIAAAAKRAG